MDAAEELVFRRLPPRGLPEATLFGLAFACAGVGFGFVQAAFHDAPSALGLPAWTRNTLLGTGLAFLLGMVPVVFAVLRWWRGRYGVARVRPDSVALEAPLAWFVPPVVLEYEALRAFEATPHGVLITAYGASTAAPIRWLQRVLAPFLIPTPDAAETARVHALIDARRGGWADEARTQTFAGPSSLWAAALVLLALGPLVAPVIARLRFEQPVAVLAALALAVLGGGGALLAIVLLARAWPSLGASRLTVGEGSLVFGGQRHELADLDAIGADEGFLAIETRAGPRLGRRALVRLGDQTGAALAAIEQQLAAAGCASVRRELPSWACAATRRRRAAAALAVLGLSLGGGVGLALASPPLYLAHTCASVSESASLTLIARQGDGAPRALVLVFGPAVPEPPTVRIAGLWEQRLPARAAPALEVDLVAGRVERGGALAATIDPGATLIVVTPQRVRAARVALPRELTERVARAAGPGLGLGPLRVSPLLDPLDALADPLAQDLVAGRIGHRLFELTDAAAQLRLVWGVADDQVVFLSVLLGGAPLVVAAPPFSPNGALSIQAVSQRAPCITRSSPGGVSLQARRVPAADELRAVVEAVRAGTPLAQAFGPLQRELFGP